MSQETAGRTMLRRHEQHQDRWSSYGSNTGILEISERLSAEELKRFEIFAEYDDRFLENLSSDVTVARWRPGAVLFEEGTYINVAFFVVEGEIELFLKGAVAPAETSAARNPIFDAQRTMIGAQVLNQDARQETMLVAPGSVAPAGITFLSVMDANLTAGGSVRLHKGEMLGEIGALSGWPMSATAKAATECKVVQIRVPALRTLRRRSKGLKQKLDEIYRERQLTAHLSATPLFRGLPPVFVEHLKDRVELISCDPDETIVSEGEPNDALYIVRSGFLKLAQQFEEGTLAVNYLSKGMTLGEVELLIPDTSGWTVTASSVEYSELIKIPLEIAQQLTRENPNVEKALSESAVARIREAGYSRRNVSRSEFLQTALDRGVVQGNSMLVIDLDVCTRCDDCVRGCASTHGGRPRFVREGEKYANLLLTSACYHCRDPLCLVGCPTGAIGRVGVADIVAIDENICIGCGTCSRGCPYDAIQMHETGQTWPGDMVPESLRGKARLVASKCDHCYTRSDGPACVKNCPNGCAYRVGSVEEFDNLLRK